MTTLEYRVSELELRVDHLVTWAGPGQAEALGVSLRQTRADMAKMRRIQETMLRTQDRHTQQLGSLIEDVAGLKSDVAGLKSDVAGLKSDVAGLKSDVAEIKGAVQEILRRLPAA